MLQLLQTCWWQLLIILVGAYLLGSVNFAIIVTRMLTKQDIRAVGSGSAGTTNVLRSQGKLPALLTAVGDLGKSIAAAYLSGWMMDAARQAAGLDLSREQAWMVGLYLGGLACILGHVYPLYFKFHGGKGVMTTLGIMLILDWRVALICLGVFVILVAVWRMVSLGSVCAAMTMAVLTWIFRGVIDGWESGVVWFCTAMAVLIAGLLVWKHVPNIRRIIAGTESKLGSKKAE